MDWARIDSWPHAQASRRVTGPVHRWHVQEMGPELGQGDLILLLHGAGGSTHSWRDLMPLLARTHRVVAIDLPGQGFTQLGARHRCGLEAMTEDIAALIRQEGWEPAALVGHSAGGAIAIRLAQRSELPASRTPKVIGINPALAQFSGLAGLVFPVMAKALAAVPFSAQLFSSTASNPARVDSLIAATGSRIGRDGTALYRQLIADRDHVNGTLLMMAQWDLTPLLGALADGPPEALLMVGENDKTVPPSVSTKAAARMIDASVMELSGLGHLAHEEAPDLIAQVITEALTIRED